MQRHKRSDMMNHHAVLLCAGLDREARAGPGHSSRIERSAQIAGSGRFRYRHFVVLIFSRFSDPALYLFNELLDPDFGKHRSQNSKKSTFFYKCSFSHDKNINCFRATVE